MNTTLRFPSLFYKQRLCATGVFMLCGVLFYLLLPEIYLYFLIPSAFAFLLGAFICKGEKRKIFLCFALGLSLALMATTLCNIDRIKAKELVGKEGVGEGVVIAVSEKEYELKLTSFDGKNCSFTVLIKGDPPEIGEQIKTKLSLTASHPESDRNRGIDLAAKSVGGAEIMGKSHFYSFVGAIRKSLITSFGTGESGGFLSAILLGEKSALSEEIKDAFRITASSHILAISGLHVTQFIGFFFCFCRVFSVNGKFARTMLYPLTLILFFLAGAGISVFRSAVMTLFASTGVLLRRRSDSVTALVFSAAVLVFFDPFTLESPSFLLSYFATFALVTCALPLSEYSGEKICASVQGKILSKTLVFATASFCISATIFVYLFPLQLLLFGEAQLLSPLYALLLVPLFQPVLILAFVFAFLSLAPALYSALSPVLHFAVNLYLSLVKLLGDASAPMVAFSDFSLPLSILFFGVLFYFYLKKRPLSSVFFLYPVIFLVLVAFTLFSSVVPG